MFRCRTKRTKYCETGKVPQDTACVKMKKVNSRFKIKLSKIDIQKYLFQYQYTTHTQTNKQARDNAFLKKSQSRFFKSKSNHTTSSSNQLSHYQNTDMIKFAHTKHQRLDILAVQQATNKPLNIMYPKTVKFQALGQRNTHASQSCGLRLNFVYVRTAKLTRVKSILVRESRTGGTHTVRRYIYIYILEQMFRKLKNLEWGGGGKESIITKPPLIPQKNVWIKLQWVNLSY